MESLLYQSIAQDMENKIKNHIWKENDKLPSERNLAEQYGVSRTAIREALKTLNEKKLVINHPGKGNFVRHPSADTFLSQLEIAMDYNDISLSDIVDAREELEVVIGRRAVENVQRHQLKEMDILYEKMEENLHNHLEFNHYDYQFHLKLAECSQNAALKLIFSSLYFITGKNTYLSVTSTEEIRRHAQTEHAEILNALKTRSPRNMMQAIRRHMKCIQEHLIQE